MTAIQSSTLPWHIIPGDLIVFNTSRVGWAISIKNGKVDSWRNMYTGPEALEIGLSLARFEDNHTEGDASVLILTKSGPFWIFQSPTTHDLVIKTRIAPTTSRVTP